jgi:hypothetical protein
MEHLFLSQSPTLLARAPPFPLWCSHRRREGQGAPPMCRSTSALHFVGDSHKSPLNNQGKPTFFREEQNTNEPKTQLR